MSTSSRPAAAPTPVVWPAGTLFGSNVPMANALGLVGEAIGDGFARIRLPYNASFVNNRADLHGGALLTLLDCTLASAARGHDPANAVVITVDLSTHFIAGAHTDVIAEARVLRRGRSLAFSQGEARDLDGNLLATATATMKMASIEVSP